MHDCRTAGIEDLPPHLVADIIRLAFAVDRRLLPWLRLSLVSRCWRGIMGEETATLELPVMLSKAQWRWLATTRIPVQSVRFIGDQCRPVPKGMHFGPTAAVQLHELLPGSLDTLFELHGMTLHPTHGRKWLDRLTRLRAVTLTGASCVHLLPAQLTFLQLNNCYESLEVRSLPAQLIFLQLNNCYESLEEPCYAHLTALRELCIEHRGGSPFAAWHFSLSALPPSLRRLRLRLPSGSVRLVSAADPRLSDDSRPAVPAAPTQLLQVECMRLVFGDVDSVLRFSACCAVTIRAPMLHFESDSCSSDSRLLRGPGGARACVAAWLAAWIARCGAASVSLAGRDVGWKQSPFAIEVSIGGQAGPPDYFTDPREMPEPVILSATFTGPGEIAALMSAPCADVGRSCRLAGDAPSDVRVVVAGGSHLTETSQPPTAAMMSCQPV